MRVVTYTDPRALRKHSIWSTLETTLQIGATQSLTTGLNKLYSDSDEKPLLPVVSANMLFSKLLPLWFSKTAQVQQYARLTGVIDALRETHPHWDQRLWAFRRNQPDVLSGMRTLAEGGLEPADLTCTTEDEHIFREIWQAMESDDQTLRYLRRMFRTLTNKPVLKRALEQALAEAAKKVEMAPWHLQDELILHGFYFLTPLQKRLFGLMEAAGYELIYLNCWDERFPKVHATWKAFFPAAAGGPGPRPEPAGQRFANIYESNNPRKLGEIPGLRVMKFPDLSAFLEHLDGQLKLPEEQQPRFCTPLSDELNDILREFYPDHYKERHFLSYPIGQFLFHLHKLWDEPSGSLTISAEGLMACFSSGLLNGKSGERTVTGRSLTLALRRVMPYFQDCQSLEQWRARANFLRDAVATEVHRANTPVPKSHPDHRFRAILDNPFRRISYLAVTPDEVADIALLLGRLGEMADEIYRSRHVSVAEHMRKLGALLSEGVADSDLELEERRLRDDLLELFAEPTVDDSPYPVKDLSEAMAYYLGAVATDDEDRRLVGSFESLDGAPLRKRQRPIHLCLLNQHALPSYRRVIPWPLTHHSFAKVEQHDCYQMLRLREEQAPNASLYLFYYALAFARDVTVSWVAQWEEEPSAESLYVLMLKLSGVPEENAGSGTWASGADLETEELEDEVSRAWPTATYPPHAVAEYASCPRRFYYSYILSDGPVFESPFHHEFLYGPLMGWQMWVRHTNRDGATPVIAPLFPQFTALRKRDLAERWGKYYQAYDKFGGREYDTVMRLLQIPAISQVPGALAVFTDEQHYQQVMQSMGQGQESEPQMKANAGKHCRFCPHTGYCDDAHLSIDDER